ncbi:MAG: VOC family protein [Acidobacteriaceae bacterium]|nr:VOC family protein [Acidobacteriaceae bacterium]
MAAERGRVIGIGGIFFRSEDAGRLRDWYRTNLGFPSGGNEAMFQWRELDPPSPERMTVWSIFPAKTEYFGPGTQQFMINYIVDDMDAFLAKLTAAGVNIDPKREDHEYGRFAWIYDADGNRIELWQPPDEAAPADGQTV